MTDRGLHHIGYWTDDLDASAWEAERLLGVGSVTVIEHVDLGTFRFCSEPAVLNHSAAFTQWGPVEIHQPTEEVRRMCDALRNR